MNDTLIINAMRPDDWPDVRRIYLDGLATGHASFETTAPTWEQWDASHLPHSRLTARSGGDVAGWVALAPVSTRECYRGVAEVAYYVAANVRRQGIGSALLTAGIASAERHGIWTLQAAVFPENTVSIRLLDFTKFRLVGRRERIAQHHDMWRDTLIYERRSQL